VVPDEVRLRLSKLLPSGVLHLRDGA